MKKEDITYEESVASEVFGRDSDLGKAIFEVTKGISEAEKKEERWKRRNEIVQEEKEKEEEAKRKGKNLKKIYLQNYSFLSSYSFSSKARASEFLGISLKTLNHALKLGFLPGSSWSVSYSPEEAKALFVVEEIGKDDDEDFGVTACFCMKDAKDLVHELCKDYKGEEDYIRVRIGIFKEPVSFSDIFNGHYEVKEYLEEHKEPADAFVEEEELSEEEYEKRAQDLIDYMRRRNNEKN